MAIIHAEVFEDTPPLALGVRRQTSKGHASEIKSDGGGYRAGFAATRPNLKARGSLARECRLIGFHELGGAGEAGPGIRLKPGRRK
jgi:hypothetical protein